MTDLRDSVYRWLSTTRTVFVASAISLGLGLVFLFVWTPHPWGWLGFDHYHELGVTLAHGGEFPTTDVPWGYAYFLAGWYRLFGERLWVPLTAQVLANAAIPLLLYALVSPFTSQSTAVLSGLLTGTLSFNTVYATTQSSDAVCTTLFVLAMLCFARGWQLDRAWLVALSGLLFGIVPQFRPNMILFPLVVSIAFVALRPDRVRFLRAGAFLVCAALALTPWTVRNYRLTGALLPTSTHGGIQLWYGTLQTGAYFNSRAYNPRSAFEAPAFDYTSTTNRPLVVTAHLSACRAAWTASSTLVYWTDRSPTPIRADAFEQSARSASFTIPTQPDLTTIYYYVETLEASRIEQVPAGGRRNPGIFFVATDHLGDLDARGDLLDVFDVVRLMRWLAWREPPAVPDKLDIDQDGQLSETDLRAAIDRLLFGSSGGRATTALAYVESTADAVVANFSDGSTLTVGRHWTGKITDIEPAGRLASLLVYAHLPWTSFAFPPGASESGVPCDFIDHVSINDPFYLREPHQMRRYTALALDNIRRDPGAFVLASLGRMAQLFIIRGSDDPSTAQQFPGSRLVYAAGFLASTMYFLVFLAGVWIAWRQRLRPLLLLLLPIAYVPLTICFVLTNMRYTVTVQPLVFVFVAVACCAALGFSNQPVHASRGNDRTIGEPAARQ